MKKAVQIVYAIPLLIFGLFHFMNASQMAGIVPSWLPFGVFWVYLTGLGLLAAGVSFIINKQVALAGKLLALMLLIFALTVHLPSIIGGNQMSMPNLLKDLAMAGAALYIAATSES